MSTPNVFEQAIESVEGGYNWNKPSQCAIGKLVAAANNWDGLDIVGFTVDLQIGFWGNAIKEEVPAVLEAIEPLIKLGMTRKDIINLEHLRDMRFWSRRMWLHPVKQHQWDVISVAEYLRNMSSRFKKAGE